jgi:uncharacterized protein (DUF1684 family)
VAAERTDTERLDAIERHGWDVLRRDEERIGWALFLDNTEWLTAPTLREAIDTAMAMQDAEEDA